jgi:hypothetical protein
MSSFEALFSGVNFKNTIQRYCQEIGWKIAEVDDKHAILKFSMDSGTNQILFIIRYETTLEFSVPSIAAFDSEDNVPHYLSTLLLKRNSQKKIGFWCIEEVGNKHVFSYMHNAELQLINTEYFGDVIRTLINECERFEKILKDIFNQR